MVGRAVFIMSILCVTFGCMHLKSKEAKIIELAAPYERYVASNCDWSCIRRIVVMPFANQISAGYPHVGYELCTRLAAELQRAGHYEIVVASSQDPIVRAQDVFATGQFDELEVLRVAREYQADAVLFANVTQYHPYAQPRIGLSLLLVSPGDGIAIASASGLWDAREVTTAAQAQAYYRRTQYFPRSLLGPERVTESPMLFQQFVCQQVASTFLPAGNNGVVAAGAILPPEGMNPQEAMMPPTGTATQTQMIPPPAPAPANNGIPPVPPASIDLH